MVVALISILGNFVKITIFMHMCENQMKIICTHVGGFSLYSCFGDVHSIYLLNLFKKSK
jgi:hypothetical protein